MSGSALPASLQPWQPWLQWFRPALALQVGELLQRLHPLLGRFGGTRQGGPAEPDGLEDLRRRGSYERLLASEWLLAADLPDEFMRRAASGEHLFLAPRPRARQVDRLIVALFDAGPLQLGAPRLAHIALWILLARRAREAGGELRWGLLHQPGQLQEATDAKNLKDLLRGRTLQSTGEEQRQQWTDWLVQQKLRAGEIWLISADGMPSDEDRAAPAAQPPHVVSHQVSLRLALDGSALQVGLRTASAVRTMALPLPDPKASAPLLTGRFGDVPPPQQTMPADTPKLSLQADPVIAPNGSRVAVPMLAGDGVLLYKLPPHGSDRTAAPKRVQWNKQGEMLALGFHSTVLGGVLSVAQKLNFWQIAGFGLQPRPPREQFEASPGTRTLLPLVWHNDGTRHRVLLLDAAHRLVYWELKCGELKRGEGKHGEVKRAEGKQQGKSPSGAFADAAAGPLLLDTQVLALAVVWADRLVYACTDQGLLLLRFDGRTGRDGADVVLMSLPDSTALPEVFLTGGHPWIGGNGAAALLLSQQDGQQRWRVFDVENRRSKDSFELLLPPGARAVGLARDNARPRYGLVVLMSNRRDILRQFKDGAEPLCSMPQPVERLTVCPTSGLLAAVLRDRSLHVYSAADGSLRMVAHGKGEVQTQIEEGAP